MYRRTTGRGAVRFAVIRSLATVGQNTAAPEPQPAARTTSLSAGSDVSGRSHIGTTDVSVA